MQATYWRQLLQTYLCHTELDIFYLVRFSSNSLMQFAIVFANNDGFVLSTSCITEHPYYSNTSFMILMKMIKCC